MAAANRLRIGVIGANPTFGWGGGVHIPVIRQLDDYELVAVCTTRTESARQSAEQFGARLAFTDPQELVSHPDIDVVSVVVKAPDHFHLAMMALQAGKHVYCEWPLAANSSQAASMCSLATSKGVRTTVGLQARGSGPVNHARDLIENGYLGRMIAVQLICSIPGAGAKRSPGGLYTLDKANGAGSLGVQGGHALDTLRYVVGDFAGFSALLHNHYETVGLADSDASVAKQAEDQILIAGRLMNGAAASVAINHGVVAGLHVSLTAYGEAGTIALTGSGGMNFMTSELTLAGARLPDRMLAPIEIPASYDAMLIPHDFKGGSPYPGTVVPRATSVNIANLYRGLAEAIRGRPQGQAPDFSTGLSLHHLLDTVERASQTRSWQDLASDGTGQNVIQAAE